MAICGRGIKKLIHSYQITEDILESVLSSFPANLET